MTITGTSGDDYLYGTELNDVFDGDAGGNDAFYGYGGDDIYYLSYGTDHDTIAEHHNNSGDAGDVIKIKEGIGTDDVRLARIKNGSDDLYVQLLASDGSVSDSLTVENYYTDDSAKIESIEFADETVWGIHEFSSAQTTAWSRGTSDDNTLDGTINHSDVFDSDAGGNDILRGYSGDDTYWLGYDTDHDTINEWYQNDSGDTDDKIKIHTGISSTSVRLVRRNNDLLVQLLDSADGAVNNSLNIRSYFTDETAKVEIIEFADGTVWDTSYIEQNMRILGSKSDDKLYGLNNVDDVFDSDAGGNDWLHGRSGNDTYWLGYGTDHDTIRDWYQNDSGDTDDKIKLHEGISSTSVRLVRSNDDLYVQLLDSADGAVNNSLNMRFYFTDETAKVESIIAGDKVLLSSQYTALIDEMSLFENGISGFSSVEDIYGHYWTDESNIAPSP